MTVVVLLILAAIWAAVLLPPALQNRRVNRPGDSIASFRNQLHVLERAAPGFERRPAGRQSMARPSADPSEHAARLQAGYRRAEARRRRRDIFLTLLGAAAVTFVGALAVGGVIWVLHLLTDLLLAGYVAMLVKLQQQNAEREMKVRYLPERRPTGQVEPSMLRRSATN